jgi:hypothetical protein
MSATATQATQPETPRQCRPGGSVPIWAVPGLPFATPPRGRLMLVHPNRPHQRQAPPPAGALCPPRRHAANSRRRQLDPQPETRRAGAHPAAGPRPARAAGSGAGPRRCRTPARGHGRRQIRPCSVSSAQGADGRLGPAALVRAARYRFRVVRWHPETPLAQAGGPPRSACMISRADTSPRRHRVRTGMGRPPPHPSRTATPPAIPVNRPGDKRPSQ